MNDLYSLTPSASSAISAVKLFSAVNSCTGVSRGKPVSKLLIGSTTMTGDPITDLTAALALMQRAHAPQKRKDGRPYWTHPLAVYDVLVLELGVRDDDAKITALLHDVVEDTPVTLAEIEAQFGAAVAGMVGLLTKPPLAAGQTKAQMLERYYAGLRAAPDVVRQIKIADRISNLRDMATTDRTFQERYLPDTRELIGVLAGTPGLDLLLAEYAKAESRLLHLLSGR